MKVAERPLGKDGTDVSELEEVRERFCFRPVTNKGVPLVAKINDEELSGVETRYRFDGMFIAAGHGP